MENFKIGDKVIVTAHHTIPAGSIGVLYRRGSFDSILGRSWWIFIPDKLRETNHQIYGEDPLLAVCWILWEDRFERHTMCSFIKYE